MISCKSCFISEELKSLFYIKYSEEGHNRRPAELQCWVNFCDFLDACEGKSLADCYRLYLYVFATCFIQLLQKKPLAAQLKM